MTKEDLVRAEETLKAAGTDKDISSSRKEEISSSQEDNRSDKENRPEDSSNILRRVRPTLDREKDVSFQKATDIILRYCTQ